MGIAMASRGFILQPTYRIERSGGPGPRRRPVVHLYGRLEEGATFLVRDDRETPHFHVLARDTERAASLGAAPLTDQSLVALGSGEPVRRVEVEIPSRRPASSPSKPTCALPCAT